MTWTYASTAPGATAKDKVRLRIGDTISTDPLLTDEEITALLGMYGDWQKASVEACRSIAAKFARQPDTKVSRVAFSNSQKAQMYLSMAKSIEAEMGMHVAPWCGSISQDWKESEQDDDDRVEPSFARGMSDTENLRLDAEVNLGSTED